MKEITLENRAPTRTNINVIPFAQQLGEMRTPVTYDTNRIGNISKPGMRTDIQHLELKNYPTYDDRIQLINMRDPNSYIQPAYYRGPYDGQARMSNFDKMEHGDMVNMQMYNQMYDTTEPDMYSSEI